MRAYQDMVFSTAARLVGDDRQAEDIAQEVFLKAYENFGNLSTSASAGGWLKTVARNLSLNHIYRYRRRWRMFTEMRREDSEESEPDVEFALPDDVLAGVDADVRHTLVEEALQCLPERQRLPLVLYHFEELSYEEIAQQLDVSLAKVKTDIFRARAALAKVLAERGVTAATSLGAPRALTATDTKRSNGKSRARCRVSRRDVRRARSNVAYSRRSKRAQRPSAGVSGSRIGPSRHASHFWQLRWES